MEAHAPRIIQVEFFLLGKVDTLEDLDRNFEKRKAEDLILMLEGVPPALLSSRIKPTVRFFDTRGYLTRLVDETKKLKGQRRALIKKINKASGLVKFFLDIRLRVVLQWLSECETLKLSLAVNELEIVVRGRYPVALEIRDGRFLPLQDDEAHELLESVAQASGMQVFTFKHGDLLSDEQVGAWRLT
ncbi:MAG: hypothetical protein V4436_03935 [Patescibacteria group bacterium]